MRPNVSLGQPAQVMPCYANHCSSMPVGTSPSKPASDAKLHHPTPYFESPPTLPSDASPHPCVLAHDLMPRMCKLMPTCTT